MVSIIRKTIGKKLSPYSLLITNLIVSFLYVFFEWLFILTKPSFMSLLPITEQAWILIFGGIYLAALTSALLLVLIAINYWVNRKSKSNWLIKLGFVVPIVVAALMAFLLIDNFTYTVFNFGVISTTGAYRAIYIVVLLVLILVLTHEIFRFGAWIEKKKDPGLGQKRHQRNLAVVLVAVFLVALAIPVWQGIMTYKEPGIGGSDTAKGDEPNIILFTVDSLDASHMSLYGYERKTTPFLDELAESSLVAQNAFTNAQGTIGSITSILTGKDPMDTQVLLADDILRGENSYQHLPGILKSHGYYSVQLSFSSYADAVDINFLNAFDLANGRKEYTQGPFELITRYLPSNNAYFYYELESRLLDRLMHVFFIKEMENPYQQVTKPMQKFNDQEKMETLVSLLNEKNQPVFVHFHWMGVHGPLYYPQNQKFSPDRDLSTQKKYDMDLYDDSILDMDEALKGLYSHLEGEALADRETILVIATDHSLKWAKVRLPLIIHFPEGENAGVIEENVQNMDIAPTLLDYLDITQPEWMGGQSLLTGLDNTRPIFSTRISSTKKEEKEGKIQIDKSFYPYGRLAVLVCDTWFEVRLPTAENSLGKVPGYAGKCEGERLTKQTGWNLILEHLKDYDFDTSTLEKRIILK